MRVAFVTPSFAGGGAERVTLALLGALDPARFESHLLVLDGRGPFSDMLPPGTPIHDLATPRLRWAMPALIRTIRRIRPEIVFSSLGYLNLGLLAARRLIPGQIIVREANLPSLSLAHAPMPRLMRTGYRRLYRRASAVICSSRRMADEFAVDFGVPRARLTVLPNPVDEAAVREAAAAPHRHLGSGVRFVAAGRPTWQKGFDQLLDMFANVPEPAHLTVLGDGAGRAALERRAAGLGLAGRVVFAGFDPVPWRFFAGADAFLLPSRWEGLPNAALEALACGTPVIATPEAGGIAETAAAAPQGAVTVVPAGDHFSAAMRAVAPAPAAVPRPSLLPPAYRSDRVAAAFSIFLERI